MNFAYGSWLPWPQRAGCVTIPTLAGILVSMRRKTVPKKKPQADSQNGRPQRHKLSAAESLQRMKEFDKRKEAFVAALRKSKDRGLSS